MGKLLEYEAVEAAEANGALRHPFTGVALAMANGCWTRCATSSRRTRGGRPVARSTEAIIVRTPIS
jgi:hypothetical protein